MFASLIITNWNRCLWHSVYLYSVLSKHFAHIQHNIHQSNRIYKHENAAVTTILCVEVISTVYVILATMVCKTLNNAVVSITANNLYWNWNASVINYITGSNGRYIRHYQN